MWEGNANGDPLGRQAGKGLIKVNGKPLALVEPEILRFKVRRCPRNADARL